MSQRKAVTVVKARTYARGNRLEKVRILDELVELTGWNRDNTRRACVRYPKRTFSTEATKQSSPTY